MHHDLNGWSDGRDTRGWDLASSSKERDGDDPDWTWGVRGHVKKRLLGHGAVLHEVWIRSMTACRCEAPRRDSIIRATAIEDGYSVAQHVEAFGAYKDAFTTLKDALSGVSIVRASRLPGDKSAKLAPLEPSFDAAVVHVYAPGCGKWLDVWKSQFSAFPDCSHDDACDATSVMYHSHVGAGGSGFLI